MNESNPKDIKRIRQLEKSLLKIYVMAKTPECQKVIWDEYHKLFPSGKKRNPKPAGGCKGYRTDGPDGYDFDCEYDTTINCDDCKYSNARGRKDPAAKCNQRKENE